MSVHNKVIYFYIFVQHSLDYGIKKKTFLLLGLVPSRSRKLREKSPGRKEEEELKH